MMKMQRLHLKKDIGRQLLLQKYIKII